MIHLCISIASADVFAGYFTIANVKRYRRGGTLDTVEVMYGKSKTRNGKVLCLLDAVRMMTYLTFWLTESFRKSYSTIRGRSSSWHLFNQSINQSNESSKIFCQSISQSNEPIS